MPSLPLDVFSDEALRIVRELQSAGFKAMFAGGCVRDALLKRVPKDFDVATNATPDAVRELFGRRRTLAFGASFGVIGVLPPKHGSGVTEVATFRSDGNYADGRRPESVTFGDAVKDAQRRDFTINGMFFDPVASQVIDYVGGLKDLASRTIRTIGEADDRFGEDKLRMLRAVRFATTLSFDLDASTRVAIQKNASSIDCVSAERIGAEMRRVLSHPRCAEGLSFLVETKLADPIWPGLESLDWARFRAGLSRWTDHSFECATALAIACLGGDADSGVKNIRQRWRLSSEESRRIQSALACLDQATVWEHMPWSELQPVMIHRDIEVIMRVALAVHGPTPSWKRAQKALAMPQEKLNPAPLLSGDDLKSAGHMPGPHFRDWLQDVRRKQLDGEIQTVEQAWDVIALSAHQKTRAD
ncbi:MAG: CCA tRNA nucleotidyltransferase [Planctomycetota bacterium]